MEEAEKLARAGLLPYGIVAEDNSTFEERAEELKDFIKSKENEIL